MCAPAPDKGAAGGDVSHCALKRPKGVDFAAEVMQSPKRMRNSIAANWIDNESDEDNDDDDDDDGGEGDGDEHYEEDTNYLQDPLRSEGGASSWTSDNNQNYPNEMETLCPRFHGCAPTKQSQTVTSDKVTAMHLPTPSTVACEQLHQMDKSSMTHLFERQHALSSLMDNNSTVTTTTPRAPLPLPLPPQPTTTTTTTASNQDWLNVHFTQLMHSLIARQVHASSSTSSSALTTSSSPVVSSTISSAAAATPLLAIAAANQAHRAHPLIALQPFYSQFRPPAATGQLPRQMDLNCFAGDPISNIGTAAAVAAAAAIQSDEHIRAEPNSSNSSVTTQTAFASNVHSQTGSINQVKSSTACLAKHLKMIAQEPYSYKSLDAASNPICYSNKLDLSSDKV